MARRIFTNKEKATAIAVHAAYFIVKENIPYTKFKALMQLQKELETPFVEQIRK